MKIRFNVTGANRKPLVKAISEITGAESRYLGAPGFGYAVDYFTIDREGTLALLDEFRRAIPDVAIRTTLIVGYPGETEQDFQELKDFVQHARFSRMGVFAYSPEPRRPRLLCGAHAVRLAGG